MRMRTQQEILSRIGELGKEGVMDFFHAEKGDLMDFVEFEHVKDFLKEGVTEKEWEECRKELTEETIKQQMIDYMKFAWEKANGCRGLSASRTMSHYTAWLWLLGDETVKEFGNLQDYQYYGKDNLVKLCQFLDLDSNVYDDGIRSN